LSYTLRALGARLSKRGLDTLIASPSLKLSRASPNCWQLMTQP
jgi:hypothetical protein